MLLFALFKAVEMETRATIGPRANRVNVFKK